jgi:hypothetical protein
VIAHSWSFVSRVTVAELIAALEDKVPSTLALIIDDQGFPTDIAGVRYDADRNVVRIESPQFPRQSMSLTSWGTLLFRRLIALK